MKNVKIKRFVFVNAEPAFVNPAKEKEVKTV